MFKPNNQELELWHAHELVHSRESAEVYDAKIEELLSTIFKKESYVAVSLQTKRPRVVLEENSGLAAVHAIDFVQQAIQQHLKMLKEKEGT